LVGLVDWLTYEYEIVRVRVVWMEFLVPPVGRFQMDGPWRSKNLTLLSAHQDMYSTVSAWRRTGKEGGNLEALAVPC
jgi:hypothetical protein